MKPITRRSFSAGLAGAAGALTSCAPSEPKRRRPNILFAIADDWAWPHAGAYGDADVVTPAFDRIAREGVLFQRAYSICPSCTPSRSSVLTGRHMWQVEEAGVLYGQIPPKYPLFTHLLEDAGYQAGFTGKGWGPGDWRAGGLIRHPLGAEFNRRLHEDPVPPGIDRRDYAANFVDFLDARRTEQPFFFWFGGTEPHRVYAKGRGLELGKKLDTVKAPPYWPDTPEIRSDILDYYAEIEWFDAQLGTMLTALQSRGELENTLIVVTSDNGMPFPRAKVNLYGPGLHMPLAVRWGEAIRAGRTIDDFVSHIDLAPTFLAAAGLPVPSSVTGKSLLAALTSLRSGTIEAQRDCVFAGLERHTMCRPDGATYPMRSIRTARHLYIRNFAPDRWPTGGPDFISSNGNPHGDVDGCPTKDFMIANRQRYPEQYEHCFGKRPAEEFYDLAADPHEVRNLAGDQASAAEMGKLRARLDAHLKKTGDPRIEGRDPWQSYVYHQTSGYGAWFNKSLPSYVRQEERDKAMKKSP